MDDEQSTYIDQTNPPTNIFAAPNELQMDNGRSSATPKVVKSKRPLYLAQDESRYEEPSYMQDNNMGGMFSEEETDQPGSALKTVKEKWNELGPLKLEDIMANSNEPID